MGEPAASAAASRQPSLSGNGCEAEGGHEAAGGAQEEGEPRAALELLRQAVQVTILTIRVKKEGEERKDVENAELGSLLEFLGPEKLGYGEIEPSPTVSTCTPGTNSKAQLEELVPEPPAPTQPPEPPPPRYFGAAPRRRVPRAGDRLTVDRSGCPRSLQLRGLLPSLRKPEAEAEADCGARPPRSSRGAAGGAGATTMPAISPRVQGSRSRSQPPAPQTNFTPALLAGTNARPSQERHPLLIAMEEQQDLAQDVTPRRNGFETSALLAHRLGEHIWDDPRKGFWSTPAEWSKSPGPGPEDPILPHKACSNKAREAPGGKRPPANSADFRTLEDMRQLLRVVDPEGLGVLQREFLVALLFWQGLARRGAAARAAVERAFCTTGDIPCSCLVPICEHAEVQLRMVEGLRRLAQRESLEPLCDFLMEGDLARPRRWFSSMKRDPTGQADIGQILRLLAQMEIVSGRQDLFRFLSHVDFSEAPSGKNSGAAGMPSGASHRKRNFRLEDFVCLLCRSTMTWCLLKTIEMLNSPGGAGAEGTAAAEGPAAVAASRGGAAAPERCTDGELGKRWAELTRHIIVSFFVNQKFWGSEARQVVMSIRPLKASAVGADLTQEQWMTLYQRVRAQGLSAILPEGEQAQDPDFLRNLACHGGDTASRGGMQSSW